MVKRAALASMFLLVWSVLIGAGGPVYAQNQTQKETEILRETHGDWDIRCAASDPTECFMVQVAEDVRGTPMVEFSIIRFPPGQPVVAGATAVVPLGTALPEGLLFQVDGGDRLRFAYDFCAPAGCVANLALKQEQISAMKRGAVATITIAAAARPETPVSAGVSLKGFTAAYEILE